MRIKLFTALAAFGLIAFFSMNASSMPCTCWDGVAQACTDDKSTGLCSKCWAGWDQGYFTPSRENPFIALETCRRACQNANDDNKLNKPVRMYVDERNLNNCKEYARRSGLDIVNKYSYRLN